MILKITYDGKDERASRSYNDDEQLRKKKREEKIIIQNSKLCRELS